MVEKELLKLNCTKVELYIQGVISLLIHATCLITHMGVKLK
jgi:hypothetical protein